LLTTTAETDDDVIDLRRFENDGSLAERASIKCRFSDSSF